MHVGTSLPNADEDARQRPVQVWIAVHLRQAIKLEDNGAVIKYKFISTHWLNR